MHEFTFSFADYLEILLKSVLHLDGNLATVKVYMSGLRLDKSSEVKFSRQKIYFHYMTQEVMVKDLLLGSC